MTSSSDFLFTTFPWDSSVRRSVRVYCSYLFGCCAYLLSSQYGYVPLLHLFNFLTSGPSKLWYASHTGRVAFPPSIPRSSLFQECEPFSHARTIDPDISRPHQNVLQRVLIFILSTRLAAICISFVIFPQLRPAIITSKGSIKLSL